MSKIKSLCATIVAVAMIGSLASGCNLKKDATVTNNKTNTKEIKDKTVKAVPEDIKELTYTYGNEKSDIVIVNTQGGPVTELENDMLKDDILSTVDAKKYLIVNVHQMQTKNPKLFTDKEISFEEAIEYDKQSVEDLAKVIKYYKDQNKKVYVLGISFGAFMTQELIAEKGIDVADKYLIMVGRLDMNEMFWKGFSEGKNGEFVDGVKPKLTEVKDIAEKNMYKLAAGLGRNRYTEKLSKCDLSKVTYIFGKTDEQVGKLTDEEINFLASKKANVLVADGGHDEAINGGIETGLKEAFGIE